MLRRQRTSKMAVADSLLASAARGSSSASLAKDVTDADKIDLVADITAIDTPTAGIARIYFVVETSGESGSPTTWNQIGIIPAIGTTGTGRATLNDFSKWIRVSYTIEGTFDPGEGITFDIQLTKHLKFR